MICFCEEETRPISRHAFEIGQQRLRDTIKSSTQHNQDSSRLRPEQRSDWLQLCQVAPRTCVTKCTTPNLPERQTQCTGLDTRSDNLHSAIRQTLFDVARDNRATFWLHITRHNVAEGYILGFKRASG